MNSEGNYCIDKHTLSLTSSDFPLQRFTYGKRLLVCGYPAIFRQRELDTVSFGALMASPIVGGAVGSGVDWYEDAVSRYAL